MPCIGNKEQKPSNIGNDGYVPWCWLGFIVYPGHSVDGLRETTKRGYFWGTSNHFLAVLSQKYGSKIIS